jgi:predicted RNase H-like HicB family nuclease
MRFTIELDREDDGRWIAEVLELPGVRVYGATRDEAITSAKALALRVHADQVAHGEAAPEVIEGFDVRDAIDDALDVEAADCAMADPENQQRIPWDRVKAKLGL